MPDAPLHLDVQARGLTVHWPDGRRSFYPVAHLRRHSPSAEARQLRDELARNPLTVMPTTGGGGGPEPLRLQDARLVGRYAVQLVFSDGHKTGLYTWDYLRQIEPERDGADS